MICLPRRFRDRGNSNKMINIAFFGTPELTTVILDSLKKNDLPPSLVVTSPDRPKGRGLVLTATPTKKWALRENISCLSPEKLDDDFIKTLADRHFDIFIVVAYGKILPEKLINLPKYGTLNVHYSLLPKYRGATPVESAILNGDEKTGVCIQKMQFKLDTGPILISEEITVPPDITAQDLRDILNKKAAEILPHVITDYVSGKIKPIAQDETKASHSSKIQKEDGLIDINGDAILNYRKYRAYFAWPRTYFFAGEKRIIISKARFENGTFVIEKVIPEGKKEVSFEIFKTTRTL